MAAILQTLITGTIGWLDVLPDGLRAMLAALVLAGALAWFEKRIPLQETHYGQSYRKTALVALLVVPMLVWLLPASRMVVFVDILPVRPSSLHLIANSTYAVWLAGVAVTMSGKLLAWWKRRRLLRALPVVSDARLTSRLTHWRTRLGMASPAVLHASTDDLPGFFDSGRQLLFPAMAVHWPASQQDVLIINALCSLKRHHHRWHRLAQLVGCVYWPVTWVQQLNANLCRDLELTASDLSDSCYQDHLGYARALRQLEQRLMPADHSRSASRGGNRSPGVVTRYGTGLWALFREAEPRWQIDRLLSARAGGSSARWKDPYDRVVLAVGQAVFLAVLLTGVTLRERPPDIEEKYLMPFGLLWKEHFHRDLELREKVQPPG